MKPDSTHDPAVWVSGAEMARQLAVSQRTLFNWRNSEDIGLQSGRHFARKTTSPQAPWVWHRERTLQAVEAWRLAASGAK